MNRRQVLASAGLVFTTGIACADMSEHSTDEKAIRAKLERWKELFSLTGQGKRFELKGYEDLFVNDDSLLVFDSYVPNYASTEIQGYQAYKELWEKEINSSFPGWTITWMEISRLEVHGDLAWTILTFFGKGKKDGQEYTGSQHGTHIWKKIKDQWHIVHEHLTGPVKVHGKELHKS